MRWPEVTCSARFTCDHKPAYVTADPDTDGTSPRLVTPSGVSGSSPTTALVASTPARAEREHRPVQLGKLWLALFPVTPAPVKPGLDGLAMPSSARQWEQARREACSPLGGGPADRRRQPRTRTLTATLQCAGFVTEQEDQGLFPLRSGRVRLSSPMHKTMPRGSP
jgi:hypothetical protein